MIPPEDLTTTIASVENTPELQKYWAKRFDEIIKNGYFCLNENTHTILTNETVINKPFTPQGYLSIAPLVANNGQIDEDLLQSTIDTAVRMLDNILDILKCNESVLTVIQDYRKIAISIKDYESYIKSHSNLSVGIDNLGNLVSNGTFRASESISEEKGHCRAWEMINKNLRNKTFEYWYHIDTGEIIDAHSLYQKFTQESVLNTDYTIIPRRNSHLLAYPNSEDWTIWSDRESSVEEQKSTLIEHTVSPIPHKNNKNSDQDNGEIFYQQNTPSHTTSQLPSSNNTDLSNLSQPSSELSQTFQQSEVEEHHSQSITLHSLQEANTLNKSKTIENSAEYADNTGIIDSQTDTLIPSPINNEDSNHTLQTNSKFKVGELIRISDKNSPFYNQIAQITEKKVIDSTTLYTLNTTIKEINEGLWRDQQLKSVELFELLDSVNEHNQNTSHSPKIVVQLLILSTNGSEVLVQKTNGTRLLPEIDLPYNTIPEQVAGELCNKKYGVVVKIHKEIGSAINFGNEDSSYKVILAFSAKLLNDTVPTNLEWISFREAQFSLSQTTRVICNKYNRLSNFALNTSNDNNNKQDTALHSPDKEYSIDQSTIELQNSTKPTTTLSNTSHYIFRLENIIQSNIFGEVVLYFDLVKSVPILKKLSSQNLTPELEYFAECMIEICNYLISINHTSKQISVLLEPLIKKDSTLAMNDLLKVIAQSLKDLPVIPQ